MPEAYSVMVVDDEDLSRGFIADLISRDERFQVVAHARDGVEAIRNFDRHTPDAVFIDLEMPKLDGFGFCEKIELAKTTLVIVTAHGDRALAAFEFEAIDFVTKPVRVERFEKTLERVATQVISKRLLNREAKQSATINGEKGNKRLALQTSRGEIYLFPHEIQFVESRSNYINVWVNGSAHLIRETMQHFCASLDVKNLIQVHRSYAANLDLVRTISARRSGGATLKLVGLDKLIPVSRSRYSEVRDLLNEIANN